MSVGVSQASLDSAVQGHSTSSHALTQDDRSEFKKLTKNARMSLKTKARCGRHGSEAGMS